MKLSILYDYRPAHRLTFVLYIRFSYGAQEYRQSIEKKERNASAGEFLRGSFFSTLRILLVITSH